MRPLNRHRHPFTRLCLWVISEVLLGHLGMDNLADCGEWVFEREWEQGAQVVQIQ